MKKMFTLLKTTLEKFEFHFILLAWASLLILHLNGYYLFISPTGDFPLDPILLFITSGISILFQIHQKKTVDRASCGLLIFCFVLIINYFLYRLGIFFYNYIVFFVTVGLFLVYDRLRLRSLSSLRQASVVLLVLALFIAYDYAHYQERLLKDHEFDRFIRHEFNLSHPITKEDLAQIDSFYLPYRHKVSSLEGLEYFTGLEEVGFYNASIIHDFSPISKLPTLERLVIADGDLSRLDSIETMETVKNLEITYPDRGKISSFQAFPNLINLYLQGVRSPQHYEKIADLDIPVSVEELSLGATNEFALEELSHLENLKVLRLFRLRIRGVESIQDFQQLEKFSVQSVYIEDQSLLMDLLEKHSIIFEDRG
ncbi:leucine-rich repeat domain-containing protein [Tindallia californiensis]|uniref:Leucine Rich repeat-containing protein n=1 Tax=Tindallia californiensis TaxID=159292 RepID=A0A1H3KDA7_9FIRM|nr:hypothetical protein [Tindallia californiensis]SDY49939.1 hypothetical protein SAMN05192546_102312 [Tindallia californiensis]